MAKGEVVVKITGDADGLKTALSQADGHMQSFDQKMDAVAGRMRSVGSTMTTGVTLPIVAGFGLAVKAAADEEQEMATLAQTMRNTVGATDSQVDAMEKFITATQNATGVSDGELRPALGKLLIAGRDVEQAQKDMAIALDIAAARGKPVGAVIEAMGKAAMGNVGALGRLGLETKNAAGETLTYEEALAKAADTMGGSAAAAADTAAGRAAIMQAKMADLTETIGTALIPILDKLTAIASKVADWFANLSPKQQNLIIGAVGLVAALGPLLTVLGHLTVVIKGVSVAMSFLAANPVVLIIAGIAALVAGVIYAYQNFETFRDVVDGVLNFVKDLAVDVFSTIVGAAKMAIDWISKNWPLILAVLTGPFGVAVYTIKTHWDTIVGFVQAMPGRIASAFVGFADVFTAPFRAAFNGVANLWNNTVGKFSFKVPSWVPGGIGGRGFEMPNIPTFDDGGIMPGPIGKHQLAWVAGGETILPTHRTARVSTSAPVVQVFIDGREVEAAVKHYVDRAINESPVRRHRRS